VRANGVPVNNNRAGFQAASDLSGVTFLTADNAGLVEENFNDTVYQGFRVSGLWDINPDFSLRVTHSRQSLESDGVFFSDPTLGDLEIQRYEQDELEDAFHNTSWTLKAASACWMQSIPVPILIGRPISGSTIPTISSSANTCRIISVTARCPIRVRATTRPEPVRRRTCM
jgi:hypothetical protein